jgi:hypothetical protein
MSRKILNGLDMTGTAISNLPDAVSAQEPATLAQLNAAIEGRKWKDPVRVASTANLTLSGTQTIDGVAVVSGDRGLVKNQSTASANGIYVVASGSWGRAVDANSGTEVLNMCTAVVAGTAGAGNQYLMNAAGPITLDTTSLTFIQVGSGGSSYTEGNGIDIAAGVISVDPAVTARKAGANIGDGSAISFNVTHNLNTTDAVVLIRETAGAKEAVIADVVFTSADVVTVSFAVAPSSNQYRVTVIG